MAAWLWSGKRLSWCAGSPPRVLVPRLEHAGRTEWAEREEWDR